MAAAHVVNGSSGPRRILLYVWFLLGRILYHKFHGSCSSFTPAIVRPCHKISASSLPNCPYFIHDERYKLIPFRPVVISLKTQFLRSSAFVKFPCVDCKKSVRTNQDAILCGSCTSWFHTKCPWYVQVCVPVLSCTS